MFTAWQSPHEIPPARVLRLTLRGPVTLGHVLLLSEMGSPFVCGGGVNMGDLAGAALVCSTTVSDARKTLRSRWIKPGMKIWGRMCGHLDFEEEANKLSDWIDEQVGGPVRDKPSGDSGNGKPFSSPWYLRLLSVAVGELGLSIPDAEAMPVKRLNQLIAALDEVRGRGSFISEEVSNFAEQVKQWEAERLKGQAA